MITSATPTIADRVYRVVELQLAAKHVSITPHLTFEAMGADSLDHIELMLALEEEFEVEIQDDDADRMTCPADAVAFIEKALAA
jgi:acyl carrier protein